MKFTKQTFEKPITGCGTAKVGEKSFSLNLAYKNEKGKLEEEVFTFKKNDLPETLPEDFEIESGKKYFASVSSDGKQLLNIRPAKGTFKVKCAEFSETKDGDILIIKKTGEYGNYYQFVPLLEVQSGNAKGIRYPVYLPLGNEDKPRFACADDGTFEIKGDPEKSKAIQSLYDFLTYSGVADISVKYPMDGDEPNDDPQAVLGTLLKAVRKQNVTFTILVADGYVKAMAEDEDTITEDEDDEDKPVKKSKVEVEDEDEEEVPAPRAKRKPNLE